MPQDGTDVIERTVSLWAVVPKDRTDVLERPKFHYGL